jgi:hypothetical protein
VDTYVKSTNERWQRGENALLRKACEAQRQAGKDCDPAFWQQLIADGMFPGRSWRALQRRAWQKKWYRPRYQKRGQGRKARVEAATRLVGLSAAAAEREIEFCYAAQEQARPAVQGTLPLADPLPRVVGGMLAVEVMAPDGTTGPLAVPLDGLVVGCDTATQKAAVVREGTRSVPTTHTFDQVMRAIERAKADR